MMDKVNKIKHNEEIIDVEWFFQIGYIIMRLVEHQIQFNLIGHGSE